MADALFVTDKLTPAQRQTLEGMLVSLSFANGRVLLEEGAVAPGLFLVEAGTVEVTKKDMGGHAQKITELKAPAVIGELELLTGDPCTASIVARGTVQAKLLPRASFDSLLDKGDAGAIQLMRNLARALGQKLTATDEVYVDMAIWRR